MAQEKTSVKPVALTLLGVAACCGTAWSAATPPPTQVRTSEVSAVDALTGSFMWDNGGQIEWTGPPFKVRATCSCRGKTPTWPVLTQQPNAYAPRSVPVSAAWFQLPCLQPARGPL